VSCVTVASSDSTHNVLCPLERIPQHVIRLVDPPTELPRHLHDSITPTGEFVRMQLPLSSQHPLPEISRVEIVSVRRERGEFRGDIKFAGETALGSCYRPGAGDGG
jgi:hypothetical protein